MINEKILKMLEQNQKVKDLLYACLDHVKSIETAGREMYEEQSNVIQIDLNDVEEIKL